VEILAITTQHFHINVVSSSHASRWQGCICTMIYLIIAVMLMNLLSFLLVYISACPVCYLPVEEAIALMPKVPSDSPVLKNLTYIYEENLSRDEEFGGSDFGGYPTLKQRSDSYDIRESMSVHCGYDIFSFFHLFFFGVKFPQISS
jgi:hypothetical protein